MTSSLLDVRRGSQTPRVANYPPYDLSAAPEVISLARRAGLILDPWQEYVLTHGLGQRLDGGWTAPKVSCWVPRQNGKGAIIEALELAWLFLFDEELVIHTAHQHRTAQKAYERLERIIRRTPTLMRRVSHFRQANGEQQIQLRDGRLLQYATRSRTAVRGFSTPKLVLDEAQELTSEQMAAILPTVSAMHNWQVWFFGTPPDDPAAWVYGLREDGETGAPRLAHFDWGIGEHDPAKPDRAMNVRIASMDTAYDCNPALGIRIMPETVEDERKPSGLGSKYPQERLGAWKPRAQAGGAIDPAQWARIADAYSKRTGRLSLGVDISVLRDFASICVYGEREDGLGHGQLVDYRPGTDWIAVRVAELAGALGPVAVGMGKGTHESLKEDLKSAGLVVPDDPDVPGRGDLAVTTPGTMSAACAQLIDAIRQGSLRIVPVPQLDEAVAGAKLNATGDTVAWARKDSAGDISPLGALTVARWAHISRVEIVDQAVYQPIFAAWR